MSEIRVNQLLELDNVISYRNKINVAEMENIIKRMENAIYLAGAKKEGYTVTATYSIDKNILDIEFLIPLNKRVNSTEEFQFKEKIKITNAVVAKHRGNTNKLQETCNELSNFIINNNLVPITAGYNVTKKVNTENAEETEIDVYVGINPNIT